MVASAASQSLDQLAIVGTITWVEQGVHKTLTNPCIDQTSNIWSTVATAAAACDCLVFYSWFPASMFPVSATSFADVWLPANTALSVQAVNQGSCRSNPSVLFDQSGLDFVSTSQARVSKAAIVVTGTDVPTAGFPTYLSYLSALQTLILTDGIIAPFTLTGSLPLSVRDLRILASTPAQAVLTDVTFLNGLFNLKAVSFDNQKFSGDLSTFSGLVYSPNSPGIAQTNSITGLSSLVPVAPQTGDQYFRIVFSADPATPAYSNLTSAEKSCLSTNSAAFKTVFPNSPFTVGAFNNFQNFCEHSVAPDVSTIASTCSAAVADYAYYVVDVCMGLYSVPALPSTPNDADSLAQLIALAETTRSSTSNCWPASFSGLTVQNVCAQVPSSDTCVKTTANGDGLGSTNRGSRAMNLARSICTQYASQSGGSSSNQGSSTSNSVTLCGNVFPLSTTSIITSTSWSCQLPSQIGLLINLVRLDLYAANITGSIPKELGNLANLEFLSLNNNHFSGAIPSELGKLSKLTYLNLGVNVLTSLIPKEIGNLAQLQVINLSQNELSGTIPPELGNLAKLMNMQLNYNFLSGAIPSELGKLSLLQTFWLFINGLTGEIPASIGNLTLLTDIEFRSNSLTGAIPSEIGNLQNLKSLNLDVNKFTGPIPSALSLLTSLNTLALQGNSFSGPIPVEITTLPHLASLTIDPVNQNDNSNMINIFGYYYLTTQTRLDLGGYYGLGGSIPTEIGRMKDLQFLSLWQCHLVGPIPSEIGLLTKLTYLYINDNLLTGDIPNLDGLDKLWVLHLENNEMNVRVVNLQSLIVFSVQNNIPPFVTVRNASVLTTSLANANVIPPKNANDSVSTAVLTEFNLDIPLDESVVFNNALDFSAFSVHGISAGFNSLDFAAIPGTLTTQLLNPGISNLGATLPTPNNVHISFKPSTSATLAYKLTISSTNFVTIDILRNTDEPLGRVNYAIVVSAARRRANKLSFTVNQPQVTAVLASGCAECVSPSPIPIPPVPVSPIPPVILQTTTATTTTTANVIVVPTGIINPPPTPNIPITDPNILASNGPVNPIFPQPFTGDATQFKTTLTTLFSNLDTTKPVLVVESNVSLTPGQSQSLASSFASRKRRDEESRSVVVVVSVSSGTFTISNPSAKSVESTLVSGVSSVSPNSFSFVVGSLTTSIWYAIVLKSDGSRLDFNINSGVVCVGTVSFSLSAGGGSGGGLVRVVQASAVLVAGVSPSNSSSGGGSNGSSGSGNGASGGNGAAPIGGSGGNGNGAGSSGGSNSTIPPFNGNGSGTNSGGSNTSSNGGNNGQMSSGGTSSSSSSSSTNGNGTATNGDGGSLFGGGSTLSSSDESSNNNSKGNGGSSNSGNSGNTNTKSGSNGNSVSGGSVNSGSGVANNGGNTNAGSNAIGGPLATAGSGSRQTHGGVVQTTSSVGSNGSAGGQAVTDGGSATQAGGLKPLHWGLLGAGLAVVVLGVGAVVYYSKNKKREVGSKIPVVESFVQAS
ncbi:UNVERIFIED_CONTAM: hypothetical protein HDU68_001464 [Siphonaria sp. JEL0065]|nr:hypothetical protein HDU68_001464 [Siphonaria sp. JEL0065]